MTNIMYFYMNCSKFLMQASRYSVNRFSVEAFSNCSLRYKSFSTFQLSKYENIFNKSPKHLRCFSVSAENFSNASEKKEKGDVIYYGPLTGRIKGLKVFTCLSSLGGLVLQPFLIQKLLDGDKFPLILSVYCFLGIFTFITPILIHLLTKKYVTEIRFDAATDIYTATTLSFFFQRKQMNFKLEDVKVPDFLPMFTTMYIKGQPLFIISDSFLNVEHYIKMMGYDKPIDIKFTGATDKSVKTQEN